MYMQNYCSTDGWNVTQGQIVRNLEIEHLTTLYDHPPLLPFDIKKQNKIHFLYVQLDF